MFMKKLLFCICMIVILSAHPAPAQQAQQNKSSSPIDMANSIVQDMRKDDPQAAQAVTNAIRSGDMAEAKRLYENYKASKRSTGPDNAPVTASPATPAQPQDPSLFERTLSGEHTELMTAKLEQFGYDLFSKAGPYQAPTMMPVGPDYVIGPGDEFTLTLWGTTEGIYAVQVSKEGEITLPKVGVVAVAGIRFAELEKTIRKHLSRYYSNFNLSIAMGRLRTMTVYVVGEVSDPGSYQLPSLGTAFTALFAAGGPTKKGTLRTIQVLRSGKVIKTIDLYDFLLKGDRSQDIRLQHEDTLFVPLIGPVAGISGTVYRQAIYEMKGEESMAGLIQRAGGIMPFALGSRIQLNRFVDNQKQLIYDIKVPLAKETSLLQTPALQEKVRNMDIVKIFPLYGEVWETVNLAGHVRYGGEFEWRQDLRVKDIIQQGQLLPTSDLRRAEVIRLSKDYANREVLPVDLEKLLAGDEAENITLMPKDLVRVYTTYRPVEKVTIQGEVVRPGTFEIVNGEKLSDLLKRIGGFTQEAYSYGVVFKRRDVKNAEARNLQIFIAKMQQQVIQTAAGGAATAVSAEEAGFAKSEFSMNQSLLSNLKVVQEQFEGRVAINITDDISAWAGTKNDVLLQDGDLLVVPKRPQEVMVMGEVHSPGALIHQPGTTVLDYVNQTGGYTDYANESQVYVLRANGFAFSSKTPSIGNVEKVTLNAGDTVFVPQKIERYATMRVARDIIDILFKTAVVLATITVIF